MTEIQIHLMELTVMPVDIGASYISQGKFQNDRVALPKAV
jgi:hypothetical protein